jgi:lysozyme
MMQPSYQLLSSIKEHEGFKSRPYLDTEGVLTFGYGCTWITEEEAEYLLIRRLAFIEVDLNHEFPWLFRLDPVRADVLRELAYNLGIERLKKFTHMIGAILVQDWATAAKELEDSKWWNQVKGRGPLLQARLRTGSWVPLEV